MVARPVDGFDASEPAFAEGEDGEAAGIGLAPYHELILALEQPRDLELQIRLVAPEPGEAVIARAAAHEALREDAGLVIGVLYRFEPAQTSGVGVRMEGAIADRRD